MVDFQSLAPKLDMQCRGEQKPRKLCVLCLWGKRARSISDGLGAPNLSSFFECQSKSRRSLSLRGASDLHTINGRTDVDASVKKEGRKEVPFVHVSV